MPITVYKCNVCNAGYKTEAEAIACESQPVVNPYNIKPGDEVVIFKNVFIPWIGLRGSVCGTNLDFRHRLSVRVRFDDVEFNRNLREGESRHFREEYFSVEQLVRFIDYKMPEIAERLGAAVHELWMAKRKSEKGWHAPADCPEKTNRKNTKVCQLCANWDDLILDEFKCDKGHTNDGKDCPDFKLKNCPQCHDCMRPFSELPDNEKELALAYPSEFFKILDEMGYMVTVKPTADRR